MKEYNADSIQVLEGLKAVRLRPGMYVGGVSGNSPSGLFRICKEVIDNSLDEYLAGKNKYVAILYDTKENLVSVIDHGRGIPTGKKKNGNYAITDAMTKLHAGGKFEQGAYSVSSGLHGVGVKAANALSEHMQIWSNDGHGWYTQIFSRGKIKSEVKKGDPKKYKHLVGKTGVVIEYKPDSKIFTDTIKLNTIRLKKELKDIQYLCPGLKIYLNIDETQHKYCSEEGLKEMVYREGILGKPFVYKSSTLDVALNWTRNNDQQGCYINSFVNISYTAEGGTHLDGLRKIILKSLREYTKEKVEIDDLLEGLVGAIHWKMKDPVYAGQTKDKLTNNNVTKEVVNQLSDPLSTYFSKNKSVTESIIKYAERMLQERSKLKDSSAILKGIDKLSKNSKNIPDKFTDADRKKHRKPEDVELFIVEGDSAGGHFKQARKSFQAMLQIRGKIINAARATPTELFGGVKAGKKDGKKTDGNKEIRDCITVLGCGIEPKCDISKLKFGKIILLMDADTDGSHIKNLMLAFFVNYIPELIKKGYVFLVDAPLFIGTSTNEKIFGKTRNEVDAKMAKKGIKKYVITRLKGWGECSSKQLSEICLNPETRKLIQLTWSEDSVHVMNKVMGDDVSFRKEMLGVN
jgi:DNA gyrase/topoisomerase IV subunit B